MSHEKIDVGYVAKLARLDLTPEEVETFQKQLESILVHVEQLSSVEIPPEIAAEVVSDLGYMRDDTPGTSLSPDAMLANTPDQAQGQLRVPKVVADA